MKIEHAAKTHVGNVRSENQDSIFSRPENDVYLVADGMGGEKAGEEASAQVVQTVERLTGGFFKNAPKAPNEVEAMLREALQQASRDVFQISLREPDKTGLGSTGSLLCFHRGLYFISQVGDSRIYRMRDGEVEQLTRDHTMVWQLYQNGVITRDQLETHPERHLLTQCVGSANEPSVDTFEGKLRERDLFLICSDGLTGYAPEDEVFRLMIEESEDLAACAGKMIQAALLGGGGDNVSAILARVAGLGKGDDWEPEPSAPPSKVPLPAAPVPDKRGEKSKKWMIAGAATLAVIAVAIFANRPRSIEVQIDLTAMPNPREARIVVIPPGGGRLTNTLIGRDGGLATLQLPGNGDYILDVQGPGILPYFETRYFSGNDTAAFRIPLRRSGRLILEIETPESIEEIVISRLLDSGEEEIKVDWRRESGGLPALDYDLDPGERHRVYVRREGGAPPFEDTIIIGEGDVERVKIR